MIKRLNIYIISSVLLFITGIIVLLMHEGIFFRKDLNINCLSQFTKLDYSGKIKSEGIMHIIFDKNKKGDVLVSANARGVDDDKIYHIERHIQFSYDIEDSGPIRIYDFNVFTRPADTASDNIFSTRIFDIYTDHRKIQINKMDNTILIGDVFSPYLMCVDTSTTML